MVYSPYLRTAPPTLKLTCGNSAPLANLTLDREISIRYNAVCKSKLLLNAVSISFSRCASAKYCRQLMLAIEVDVCFWFLKLAGISFLGMDKSVLSVVQPLKAIIKSERVSG